MRYYSFKNSILIVVFNYSNCVNNKDFIKNLYANHFKQIIFYSDLPHTIDNEVNYINIQRGYYVHKIFEHFYDNYKEILSNAERLFYTMDDNIINTNILNLYRNDKILFYYNKVQTLDNYNGWHWDNPWGKIAINQLLKDSKFKSFNIDKFSGDFSDWFYLPKRYLTDDLFALFKLFSTYKIFLELSIPSIINNIEKDETQYLKVNSDILWENDRTKFFNKEYIRDSLNKKHNLIYLALK